MAVERNRRWHIAAESTGMTPGFWRSSRRWPAVLASAGVGLVLLGLLASLLIRVPIPPRQGRATLPGLRGEAVVKFDRRAVPHVRARTEADAWRVLGWLHAGNRMFQMELRRRADAGRISEIVGSAAVAFDERARRRAGPGGDVDAELAALSPRVRVLLDAYADGVNAYVASRPRPMELAALRLRPEPWTALDSLRVARLMFSTVTISDSLEEYRFTAARRIGMSALLRILDASEDVPTFVPMPSPYPFPGARTKAARDFLPDHFAGSNAWALAGTRTASGRPLLAGDPHLPAEMPGVWYAAHLTTDDGLDVAGLTLPGTPGVIMGHNGLASWGLTMNQADDSDLFLERVDRRAKTYEWRGQELPLASRTERIRVKGSGDVLFETFSTRHGPIVSWVGDDGEWSLGLARSWSTTLTSGSLEAFLDASRAHDSREIARAWSRYGGPPLNVCWATADGHIGLLLAGAVPRRRKGDGRLPVPGWTGEFEWDGLLPLEALPRLDDPPEGFVASANDDWTASGKTLSYSGDFAGRERVDRIRAVLAPLHDATADDMRALQGDVLSLYATRVKAALDTVELHDAEAARARGILDAWDGRFTRRGPARLFGAFVVDLRRRAFAAREARAGVRLPAGFELMARMIEGRSGADLWDDPGTAAVETRESVVSASLSAALERVEREDGRVPSAWNWGRVHALTYQHVFSSVSKPLGFLLNRGPIELPGETFTVNVAAYSLREGSFEVDEIPSARLIVDLGNPNRSRLVLPIGESGHLADPHADDQLAAWASGRDFPFPFTPSAVDAGTVSTLLLEGSSLGRDTERR